MKPKDIADRLEDLAIQTTYFSEARDEAVDLIRTLIVPRDENSVAKLKHWLDFAKTNRPNKENYLWGVGYEAAPIHSDWLEDVLDQLDRAQAEATFYKEQAEHIRNERRHVKKRRKDRLTRAQKTIDSITEWVDAWPTRPASELNQIIEDYEKSEGA